VYRLTGDERYAERLWTEVDAASRFPDWNPAHFLDTAEMTCAIAIAYDWLHDRWNDGQRKQLREAIVRLGLEPALKVYRGKGDGFSRRVNNWNQVCNGGILTGALAVAKDDDDPATTAMAGEVISRAVASLPIAMKQYAPDGAWGEGPGYWNYATEYNCIALAALRSACGTDFGLAQMPGFSKTGDMPLAFTGPIGLTFNYADAGPGFGGASALFWLASAFDTPAYAALQIPYAKSSSSRVRPALGGGVVSRGTRSSPGARSTRCSARTASSTSAAPGPIRARRSSRSRAATTAVSHAHLDLGSFVFDAIGQRWAIDVGPDDYNRPGYFDKNKRWTFYRCRAEGNNCLLINPGREPDQTATATADVKQLSSEATRASAVVDLTRAYEKHGAASVRRGFALIDNRTRLLVQDELRAASAEKPLDYWWFMHTDATVDVSANDGGATAILKKGGETLTARIVSPAGARFSVMAATSLPSSPPEPPAAERSVVGWNDRLSNVRKLTIHIENVVRSARRGRPQRLARSTANRPRQRSSRSANGPRGPRRRRQSDADNVGGPSIEILQNNVRSPGV
jgi:hypothetical protein